MFVFGFSIGFLLSTMAFFFFFGKFILKERNNNIKYKILFELLGLWNIKEEKGYKFGSRIDKNECRTIGIYGVGVLGKKLVNVLCSEGFECVLIDSNASVQFENKHVFSINEILPAMDLLIVTPITYFDEIEKSMSGKVNCPIVSLKKVIEEL